MSRTLLLHHRHDWQGANQPSISRCYLCVLRADRLLSALLIRHIPFVSFNLIHGKKILSPSEFFRELIS